MSNLFMESIANFELDKGILSKRAFNTALEELDV